MKNQKIEPLQAKLEVFINKHIILKETTRENVAKAESQWKHPREEKNFLMLSATGIVLI